MLEKLGKRKNLFDSFSACKNHTPGQARLRTYSSSSFICCFSKQQSISEVAWALPKALPKALGAGLSKLEQSSIWGTGRWWGRVGATAGGDAGGFRGTAADGSACGGSGVTGRAVWPALRGFGGGKKHKSGVGRPSGGGGIGEGGLLSVRFPGTKGISCASSSTPLRQREEDAMAEESRTEDVGDLGRGGGGGAVARSKRKRPRGRQGAEGPTVTERVLTAAAATEKRRGLSLTALKKALAAKGYDVARHNGRVNRAVRQLVKQGSLVKTSGAGAAGSFRLGRAASAGSRPPPAQRARKRPSKRATPAALRAKGSQVSQQGKGVTRPRSAQSRRLKVKASSKYKAARAKRPDNPRRRRPPSNAPKLPVGRPRLHPVAQRSKVPSGVK
ncbi:histone H1-like [Narcine bancroftii]|uniref:histone H1-like n=1 Tax=Narcine bancroftii TaxID=1343680 RepID=UPI00383167EB